LIEAVRKEWRRNYIFGYCLTASSALSLQHLNLLHLYLQKSEFATTSFANGERQLQPKEIILCESIFDALSFWVNGFTNVTASYGVSGFTSELRQFIVSHARLVYIAYDNDKAGNLAAEKLHQELGQHNVKCLRVNFKPGQDANQFILATKTAQKDLKQLLVNATSMTAKAA